MPDAPRDPDAFHLDDTVADEEVAPAPEVAPVPKAPPPLPTRAPAPRPEPEAPSLLSETIVDTRPDRAKYGDVDLTRIFDRHTSVEDNPAARYDPEAGRTNVAVKFTAATEVVTQAVRGLVTGALFTPFGKLLLSITVALAGIALIIAAATWQEQWMIIAAAAVTPVALVLVYWRYQTWLGHKRYIYRLLETLGEDVSGFSPDQAYRRTRVKTTKRPGRR